MTYLDTIAGICIRRGVTQAEIQGPRRHPHLVEARTEVTAFLRYGRGWSYEMIARFLNRDHSTVMRYVEDVR